MMFRIPALLAASLVVLGAGFTAPPAAADDPSPGPASAAERPMPSTRGQKSVVVVGTRVHVGDVMPRSEGADLDLGPAPMAGGSRLVTKADIVAAFDRKQMAVPAGVPDAVRITRGIRHLAAADLNDLVRNALGPKMLGHGVTLANVRAERAVDVADGWTRVDVDVPRAPKKAGTFSTRAIASLFAGDDVIARLAVPVDLDVSTDGAAFDVARGAWVTLVIQRSLVEVRTPSVAAGDADIGDALAVQLRPSGRVVRARLVSRDQAVAIDGDR